MNKALNDLVMNDVFVNILYEKLSDEDLRRIFSFHGEIQFPTSTNNAKNLKTDEQIVINFKSRSHLLRTMAVISTKLEEIRKNDFSINILPDDCLLYIFSFLPLVDKLNIERVCKRWHDISSRVFTGIRELNLVDYWSKNTIYSIFKQCGRFTKILKFPSAYECETLLLAIQFCQLDQLREIQLQCNSDDKIGLHRSHFMKLLRETKNLETLIITAIRKNYDIDEAILLCSHTLEKLNISSCVWQQGSMRINLDQFPNLRELSCRDMNILSDERQFNPETSTNFQSFELYSNKISRNFIENIKFCTSLKKIILDRNYSQISADDILDIVKNCKKIEELHLNDFFELTPECFQEFSQLPSLENLRIKSLGNAKTLHLQHLTNLKELIIYDCTRISEHRGLTQLITNSSKLSELSLFSANELDESFLEEVSSIFSNGLREKPLTLKIEVERYNWGRECNVDFDNPLLKLEIRGNSSEDDDSEWEGMGDPGSYEWPVEEEEDIFDTDSSDPSSDS